MRVRARIISMANCKWRLAVNARALMCRGDVWATSRPVPTFGNIAILFYKR